MAKRGTDRIAAPRLPDDLLVTAAAEPVALEDGGYLDGLDVGAVAAVDPGDEVDGLTVERCRLRGLRLTGLRVRRLRLTDVVVEDCELSALAVVAGSFTRVAFRRCRMAGAALSALQATDVGFDGCRLDDTSLAGARLDRCHLVDCELGGADLSRAVLSRSRLLRCRLRGATFTGAKAAGLLLHGSELDGLRGADSLRGAVIGSDQVVPLGVSVLAALQVRVDDDLPAG